MGSLSSPDLTVPGSPKGQPGTFFKGRQLSPNRDLDGPANNTLSHLRTDLSTAQRSRAELQERVKALSEELEKLRSQASRDTRLIGELTREKGSLERRLKDRDEELKGKSNLVEVRPDLQISCYYTLHYPQILHEDDW